MKKNNVKFLLFFISFFFITNNVNAEVIPPVPIDISQFSVECQFYSADEDSLIGKTCYEVKNPSNNCSTKSTHVSSVDSFGNPDYYGSNCNFQVLLELASKETTIVTGDCGGDKIVTARGCSGTCDENYLRFYCDPKPQTGILPIFTYIGMATLFIVLILGMIITLFIKKKITAIKKGQIK